MDVFYWAAIRLGLATPPIPYTCGGADAATQATPREEIPAPSCAPQEAE